MPDDLDFGSTIRGFSPGQKVFGRYTLKKILGRGGMGLVWQAHDETLRRDIAIKVLPEMISHDEVAVRDLQRETARSQQLSHPHILRIYDFAEQSGVCGITMELVEGGNLSQRRLRQPNEVFEVEDLSAWVEQLCGALAYAHEKVGVVHRDLKPANLMIDARGDLKITDFGISATLSDSTTRVSKGAGTSGTPLYMSPQQMMGEKPAVTDDIYALGATLYEMLTGKPPFYSGRIEMQVMQKMPPTMAERRIQIGVVGSTIPEAWESTISACLSKAPIERPQNAAQFFSQLLVGGRRQEEEDESRSESANSNPRVGNDVMMTIPLTKSQMKAGGIRKVSVRRSSGEVAVEVKLPKNLKSGSKLRLRGLGVTGAFGGQAGDLYLVVDLKRGIGTYCSDFIKNKLGPHIGGTQKGGQKCKEESKAEDQAQKALVEPPRPKVVRVGVVGMICMKLGLNPRVDILVYLVILLPSIVFWGWRLFFSSGK